MIDFKEWWATEPFGFDHPETKEGILNLLKTRDQKLSDCEKKLEIAVEALNEIRHISHSDQCDANLMGTIRGRCDCHQREAREAIEKVLIQDNERALNGNKLKK